ncbi:ABC transporter ATP-binding protein [Paludibacterium purpuratum]|uniref:Putative spermidine/putrescine transport system ATP-binding protein n=1 Tax=Paludibacterium purpuratum TaxID=1144873 RepID=A0A4R7B7U8_9NEIS|nr:ABC transporter ATP-binding protein [Paludibacterium purpuratum]TDR79922.1 putative spermidine/putrescine transport system ATP-binding protein [Paludibacterium purpuratum]
MTYAVEFQHLSRTFDKVRAVDNVSLQIEEGEFFSMLGPSGSGKTTCLRLIAGFEQPSAGSVRIFGQEAAGLPPYRRDVNTVFQDYALFPHMSVADNVAYGLMVQGVDKRERQRQAQAMLELVKLGDYGDRRPAALSGGQRQRVALARALIKKPRVLLLDEPLGALDLKLREQMQIELKSLQRQLGITFIYVTHDQGEALSMSDRVAVFNRGGIEQVATPRVLYTQPATAFVADFVGTSNVFDRAAALTLCGCDIPFSIRPERIRIGQDSPRDDELGLTGELIDIQYLGATSRFEVRAGNGKILSVVNPNQDDLDVGQAIGATVRLSWPKRAMHPLDAGENGHAA